MADEPLPPEVLAAFAKALKERNDRELQAMQGRHDRDIKDLKQIYDDIIKDQLLRSRAADHQNIIKEKTFYLNQDIALKNRRHEFDIGEKKENYPRELDSYIKQYQDAQNILKHLDGQEPSDKRTAKFDALIDKQIREYETTHYPTPPTPEFIALEKALKEHHEKETKQLTERQNKELKTANPKDIALLKEKHTKQHVQHEAQYHTDLKRYIQEDIASQKLLEEMEKTERTLKPDKSKHSL